MPKLIPRDSFTIHSELNVEAIATRLSQSIETIPNFADAPLISIHWSWQKPPKPYEVRVTSQGFTASRIINYQNSFLPRIKGKFEPLTQGNTAQGNAAQGTAVHITMALHPWVTGFSAVWLLLWLGMVSPMLIHVPFNSITLMFWGVPLTFFGIAWLGFWAELRRSRKDFEAIIVGRFKL